MRFETFYITLSSAGGGSVSFVARKAGVTYTISKITVEVPLATTGRVVVTRNNGFMSEANLSEAMTIRGPETLYTSEYVTLTVSDGPPARIVTVKFFYDYRTEGQ